MLLVGGNTAHTTPQCGSEGFFCRGQNVPFAVGFGVMQRGNLAYRRKMKFKAELNLEQDYVNMIETKKSYISRLHFLGLPDYVFAMFITYS